MISHVLSKYRRRHNREQTVESLMDIEHLISIGHVLLTEQSRRPKFEVVLTETLLRNKAQLLARWPASSLQRLAVLAPLWLAFKPGCAAGLVGRRERAELRELLRRHCLRRWLQKLLHGYLQVRSLLFPQQLSQDMAENELSEIDI